MERAYANLSVVKLSTVGTGTAGGAHWVMISTVPEIIAINFDGEMMKGTYKAVTANQRKKWIDEKKDPLIVDTMPMESSSKKQHIPAAVRFEFPVPEMNEMDEKKKAEFLKLSGQDKERTPVFNCGFVECTGSHNAAMWEVNLGCKNAYRFPGGIMGRSQADLPTIKGEK